MATLRWGVLLSTGYLLLWGATALIARFVTGVDSTRWRWVAARVPAHFILRKSERRRERLDISTDDDGTLSVVNGLGSDITRLIVVDHDGGRWTAQDLAAGQSVALTPVDIDPDADPDDPSSVAELIRSNDWSAAKTISRNPGKFLTPGSYYAQIAGSPFLDPGLEGLKEHRTDCVVLGYFGEGE